MRTSEAYLYTFAEECSLVHQLLGNAAYVDAGAAEAPDSAVGRRRHIVQDGHLQMEEIAQHIP